MNLFSKYIFYICNYLLCHAAAIYSGIKQMINITDIVI